MNGSGVVLDANVLIPASLRDLLLRAAAAGLYHPSWSDDILAEVERNLLEHGMTSPDQARRLIDTMRRAFPDATVAGRRYERLKAIMPNDPKDRHILAAAVAARARTIVTFNLRDFPPDALTPLGVEAHHPDSFVASFFSTEPELILSLVREQAADLRSPPRTVDEVLDSLSRHVPQFASPVRRAHHRPSKHSLTTPR